MNEPKNTRGRNEYMKLYMSKRRPPSQKALADKRLTALKLIITRLDGNAKPLAIELREIAEKGL